MRAGKIAAVAALGLGVMLLGGCEMLDRQQKWEPQEDAAISISEDGVITEYVQDTLDESYYSASELEKMITSDVADYNSKHGENTIQVKSYEASDDGKVHLVMEYATADDYALFNNVEFYSGSMINAQLEGYLFDGSFKKVKNGVVQGSAVSGSEVVKKMAAEVLVLFCQLLPGLFQLFALGLHTELCRRSLFLLALFAELGLRDTLSRSVGSLRPGLFPVRGVGGLRPSLLLGLIRFSFHSSYPPGG